MTYGIVERLKYDNACIVGTQKVFVNIIVTVTILFCDLVNDCSLL